MENPEEIKRSWALQSQWQTGPKTVNKLQPPVYSRIAVPFVQTWREQAQPTLDWGAQQFSCYIPEGVRCISAAYLQINLPSAQYRAYPGLSIIKDFTLRSAGQIVYQCDWAQFLSDYCESLQEQKLARFAEIYLGGAAESQTDETRSVKLPLLLPNSTYMRRSNNSTAGHGVFGCFLGNQKVELQITLNSAAHTAKQRDVPPASIAGQCSLLFHTVEVPNALRRKYEDVRGFYNIITRRFTQLTPDWKHYSTANTLVIDSLSQPTGTCTEVMLLAIPHEDHDDRRQYRNYVLPTKFEIVHDMVVQKSLDTRSKIQTELFTNGFAAPDGFSSPARLCFANHCATDSTNIYTGGYDMSQASTLQFRFSFDQAVDYRLVAVQISNTKISASGIITSSLDGQ